MHNPYGCIAYPCQKERKTDSAFCTKHHKEHESSKWVKAWRVYQAEIHRVGDYKKVAWVPPRD